MLTNSQRNNCLLIAQGKLRIKDLNHQLSKEEKARIKLLKEIINERKNLIYLIWLIICRLMNGS